MNKYIALFIASLIKIVGKNYQYTDKWRIKGMKKSAIYLPIDKNGNPDWAYMETYMRKVSNKVKKKQASREKASSACLLQHTSP